jgi:flavin reductase (DIM6/NTAB) family NADH-FMN oxidoreductase RutF
MSVSHLAEALGRVPSGLFILTVRHKSSDTGMLASWVMQAGFEPPMITVAVKRGRHVAEWITAEENFVLNLVGENQKSLLSHFGRGFEPGQDAFAGLAVERSAHELPILSDALGHLECSRRNFIDSGDHRIFLAEVVGGRILPDGQPYVHIRKNGLKY